MKYEDFTAYLNSIRPDSDTAAEIWLEWAKELERLDSSEYELPKGEYKTAEDFLQEFAERFRKVQERHGDDIAGQIISLADIPACPFPVGDKTSGRASCRRRQYQRYPRHGGGRYAGGLFRNNGSG